MFDRSVTSSHLYTVDLFDVTIYSLFWLLLSGEKMCEIKCCAFFSPVGAWEAGLTGLDLGRSRRSEEGGHWWK